MSTYLCGDIGGTNSRLFLLRAGKDPNSDVVVAEKTYPSTQFTHLTPIIKKFFSEFVKSSNDMPAVACLAIAGPVKDNHCNITNLGWDLSGEQMAKDLKMSSVLLVNDFVALGYGLLALDQKDLVPLTKNKITPKGVKACVGAGTGLGETFLTWNGRDYDCWPAEGGHADFAPRNELEYKLLAYIKNDLQITRVSVERVVSGLGIPYIYSFLRDTAGEDANPEVERRLKTEDKAFVISQFAEKKECPICVRAMEIFIGLYGAEVGNFCLKTLPFGGMYVAGGIAPKSMWAIKENDNFMKNLLAKGRLQSVLEDIPVFVVLHKNPGFLGAKVMGRRLLTQAKPRSKL